MTSNEDEQKDVYFYHGEIKTPPYSHAARIEVGKLIRALQMGEKLSLPHSRPMPTIGKGFHELRVNDKNTTWRVIYFIDTAHDTIVIFANFAKKTNKTPNSIITA